MAGSEVPTVLFTVTDFDGDLIAVTEKDWNRITSKHQRVMEPYLDEVRATLESPAVVFRGRDRHTKAFYRKDLITDRPYRGCYVAVFVRYDRTPATLKTAYLATNISGRLGGHLYLDPKLGGT